MYELKKVGSKTYYIDCPAKIGIYCLNDSDVCLIDSGNDKETAKKVLNILNENDWKLKYIINTHSNADHVGGNQYLQDATGCEIFNNEIENAFTNYPILESSFLYGGYPPKDLQNKFLFAKSSRSKDMSELSIVGIDILSLPGHFFNMIGVETSDSVVFLADCIFSENIINKYHIFFIYDVEKYLETLEFLRNINARYYIPSHCDVLSDIHSIIDFNKNKIEEIIGNILLICKKPIIFEDIMQELFNIYNLSMNMNQYVLVGSTIKSYLSYLYNQNKLNIEFTKNKLYWSSI